MSEAHNLQRRALGARGEQAAATWYLEAGYALLAANWRCATGEVDLILGRGNRPPSRPPAGADGRDQQGESLVVFCEVKTRSSSRFGTGFDAVTVSKQRRLRRLAARWLADQGSVGLLGRGPKTVRFDVAAVTPGPRGSLSVEVLEAAF